MLGLVLWLRPGGNPLAVVPPDIRCVPQGLCYASSTSFSAMYVCSCIANKLAI